MSRTASTDDADHDPEQSRRRYEHVLRIVAHNTGGPQAALVSEATVCGIATRGGLDPSGVKSSIQAAVENDDLLRTTRRDGRPRLALADEQGLRSVILEEVDREHPDQQIVGRCNQLLAAGDDDE